MTIRHITIDSANQSVVVSAENSLGFPVLRQLSGSQLGADGLAAMGKLLEKAQGLLPADPPDGVLNQIRDLEGQLADLRKQAGITPPEVLL